MVIDGIDYLGIDEVLPNNIEYFKEELIYNIFNQSNNTQSIHTIVSVAIDTDISSIKIIKTPIRVSNEGQRLSGKKLLIEVILNLTIKYTNDNKEQYVYISKEKINKIFYITVPLEVNGIKIEDLARKKKFTIKPYVEDLYAEVRDEYNIYTRALLLLTIKFDTYI